MIKTNKIMVITLIGILFYLFLAICIGDNVFAAGASNGDVAKKGSQMVPFYWMISIVGGCIAITLSYVSWRKYQGEKKKQQKKDKSVD